MFRHKDYPVFVFAAVKSFYAVFIDFKNLDPKKIFSYIPYNIIPKLVPSAFEDSNFFSAKIRRSYFFLL